MEIWDLYDKNRRIIGSHIRGEMLPSNGYHLVVHVWIKNKSGLYLMTKRAKTKVTYPGKWECVGGSVLRGETSINGALREVKEEVGIELNALKGELYKTIIRDSVNGIIVNDICDIWIFDYDGDVDLNCATTDEVEEIRWLTKEAIIHLRERGELVEFIKDLNYFVEGDL